ncbi:MAG: alpha/beta fold hydrolase [Gemmatimonadota bacterium]
MARAGWQDRARSLGRKLVRVLVAMGALAAVAAAAGAAWEAGQQRAFARAGFDPPGKLVDIGGRRLHLVCAGRGDPGVMLIGGLGDPYSVWAPLQAELARRTRTCAYDRAGVGWSDPADTPRTAEAAARDLAALLAAARPFDGAPVLVGHSIGGLYALHYAGTHPGNVTGLVLIDPTTEELYEAAANWRSDALYRVLWPVLGRLGILRLRFRRAHDGLDPDSLDRLAGVASGHRAARIAAREYGGLGASFPAPSFAGPLLVLSARGSSRPALRRSSHARLAEEAADGRMIEIDAGHYIYRDRPDTVIAVIGSFLD